MSDLAGCRYMERLCRQRGAADTGASQNLSRMGWILPVMALLRGVARVDVQSPGISFDPAVR